MSAYEFPFVGRPLKGNAYYEIQIGPIVFQWRHKPGRSQSARGLHCGPVCIWRDTAWWHEATYPIRRLRRRK